MEGNHPDQSAEPVEVFEHIPWGQLKTSSGNGLSRVVYLIAGAIAAAAVGVLIGRSVGGSPTTAVVPEPVTVSLPVVTTTPTPAPTAPPLTEADLLAATPGLAEVSAAARAEWFVTDYFSSGGDPGAREGVLDALPDGATVPFTGTAVVPSYVDWAAASRVEAVGADRFRVTVLFRPLAADAGGAYVRLPVRAVDVIVQTDAAGGTRVVDLPMPAALSAGPAPAWPDEGGEVPDSVRAAAGRIAGSWGSEPSFIEGGGDAGRWRVVVGVADEAGIRWPVVLWLSDLGDPLVPAS